MSYSVFSTMTVASAVAEATLMAGNRDREARKTRAAQKKTTLGVLRGLAKALVGRRVDDGSGCGRAA